MVFHTHDRCRHINNSKALIYDLFNSYGIILDSIWILCRITVINTVDCLCKKDNVCLHFNGTQHNTSVSRKIWVSGTASKENNLSLCKCFICCILREQLCKGAAGKWCEDFSLHACGTEDFRYIDTVHNSC